MQAHCERAIESIAVVKHFIPGKWSGRAGQYLRAIATSPELLALVAEDLTLVRPAEVAESGANESGEPDRFTEEDVPDDVATLVALRLAMDVPDVIGRLRSQHLQAG
jgi:hypothetical protein